MARRLTVIAFAATILFMAGCPTPETESSQLIGDWNVTIVLMGGESTASLYTFGDDGSLLIVDGDSSWNGTWSLERDVLLLTIDSQTTEWSVEWETADSVYLTLLDTESTVLHGYRV